MARRQDCAALLERNRRIFASLTKDVPKDLDPESKLIRQGGHFPGRQGLSTVSSIAPAFVLLETGGDAEIACDIIEATLKCQDLRDPASPSYGNFFWYTHWTEVNDPNAATFMAPWFARIWERHRDKLLPGTRRLLEERFPLMLNGLLKQPWNGWNYSNIFLLTTAGLLMVSKIVRDSAALAETTRRWEEWIDKTSLMGVPEFNSPTYTPICILGLLDVREAAPTETFRRQSERALEYFFLDFLCHCHPEIGLLTGAFSRGYRGENSTDIRHDVGRQALFYHQLGEPMELPGWGLNVAFSDYLAPDWILAIARSRRYPLTARATSGWEEARWVRTNYMARKYTVGSFSNGFYSILQVPVLVTYDAPQKRKTVYTRGEPELGTCYADQIEDSVLAAFCYNFADGRHRYGPAGPETRNAKLSLSMGATEDIAQVLVDGKPWDRKALALAPLARVVFKAGPVAVGVAPVAGHVRLEDEGPGTNERPFVLVDEGGEVRLEMHLYRGKDPAETVSPREQVGFYLRVAEEDDLAAFAPAFASVAVEATVDGETWKLSARDGIRKLGVTAALSAANALEGDPRVGLNHPERGWLLRSSEVDIKVGDFARIARGKAEWNRK